jgi:aconitate hydratase
VDDSLFVFPPEDGSGVEIVRGPNIGRVPQGEPLPDELRGRVSVRVGDKITTDHIMPAGARLKYRSNIEKYSGFVFENVDPEFAARAAERRDRGEHNLIVAGESYGQGSSREHAAMCPRFLGVRAVAARSMERIHLANLVNFGILPLLFEPGEEAVPEPDEEYAMPGVREAIRDGQPVRLVNITRGGEIRLRAELSARQREILLAGGLLAGG